MTAYALPLDYPPGTDQRYSDLGYAVAGRMAAVAMQADFPNLVRELVLEPAGLIDTFLPAPADVSTRIAYVSGALGEGTDGAIYSSAYGRGLAHPAFGAVATLPDLLAFGALFTPHAARSLLSGAGLATMTSDQTCGDEPGEHVIPPAGVIHPWGIGFMLKGRAATMELVSPASFGHWRRQRLHPLDRPGPRCRHRLRLEPSRPGGPRWIRAPAHPGGQRNARGADPSVRPDSRLPAGRANRVEVSKRAHPRMVAPGS